MAISDLYFNPGVALGIGTLSSFIFTFILIAKWKMNYEGVIDSTGVLMTFAGPGLLGGILSAIFHANTARNSGEYILNADL